MTHAFIRFSRLVGLGLFVLGCKTLAFWESEPETPVAAAAEAGATAASPNAPVEEQDLKVAKLWARLDELEEEQFRLKERMRVIEKGLTLGLIPEELKTDHAKAKAAPKPPPAEPEAKPPKEKAPEPVAVDPKAEPPDLSPAEVKKYEEMFGRGHDLYRSGRYGQAAAEFAKIGEQFGDKVRGGQHLFWIARCWSDLKEYATARQRFQEFLEDSPSSPWAPRAQLELGRVEWRMGLNETAIARFRDLIKKHPFEDAAEMAKMELEHLDKTL